MDEKTLPVNWNPAQRIAKQSTSTQYRFASCQSPGKARGHNEDTLFTLSSEIHSVDAPVYFGIFLVADGMGGHQSGEVASYLAVQAVSRELMDRLFDTIIYEGHFKCEDELFPLICEAINKAQELIHQRVPGGGTTLTMALVLNKCIYSAHVGDSRLYLIDKAGHLTLKTKDHSLVKRLVDLGEITEQAAGSHPQRNVLYRALGQEDSFETDLDQFSLEVGERMMICSDGLWGVLDSDQLERSIKNGPSLEKITCELVNAANEAGGPDNISVILVERIA